MNNKSVIRTTENGYPVKFVITSDGTVTQIEKTIIVPRDYEPSSELPEPITKMLQGDFIEEERTFATAGFEHKKVTQRYVANGGNNQ